MSGARECPPRTPWSVGAGLASVLTGLVLVLLVGSGTGEASYVRVLLVALAATTLVVGCRLTATNCPESRVTGGLLGAAVVAGTLLNTWVGLPGSGPTPPGPAQWCLLVLGTAVLLLLGLEARRRPPAQARPYAR